MKIRQYLTFTLLAFSICLAAPLIYVRVHPDLVKKFEAERLFIACLDGLAMRCLLLVTSTPQPKYSSELFVLIPRTSRLC